ncbi:OsmC family peroxiredoxin [Hymenobacter profundi]|uniref:OsmC family peroxiredoxin n=1 Tax=Hymenobacter profundi TaxID=1982110 RepID=A0ABS6WYN7_9BACT|nr:OsmC family peroxiredoxin [Hymenobacter profundi]MBW3128680.1 OsmC family peroxiredoxin [Hymenobacter profundi]
MNTLRTATALWQGTGQDGTGRLNTPTQFFHDAPYSFKSRFTDAAGTPGTNPEELLAAAHATCFSMALGFALQQADFVAEELRVEAAVALQVGAEGAGITGVTLQLSGRVPGITETQFLDLAAGAKVTCPLSRALSAVPIHLDATLAA